MSDDTTTPATDADTFELDLEADGGADTKVEEAMKDALDAVEKRRRKKASKDDSQELPVEILQETAHREADPDLETNASGEADRLKEQLLRTLADFDNYRKRTDREKRSLRALAISDVFKEMLAVIDNLERATAASGTIEELKGGLEMVLRQQADVLRRFDITQLESVGKPFDPAVHEAVARDDSEDVEVPTVLRELQKGYKIGDRLLRPSMVHVAMPAAGRNDN